MAGEEPSDDVLAGELLREYSHRRSGKTAEPLIAIQGGGAKGGWQGGVLSQLLGFGMRPACCFGSSAGALNAVLVSAWLDAPGRTPFSDFWTALADGRLARLGRVGPSAIGGASRLLGSVIGQCVRHSDKARLPSVVKFEEFREEIGRALPIPTLPTQHTYLYCTNIDGPPPSLLNSQNLFSFHWAIGKQDVECVLGGTTGRADVLTAVASSCCLPFVEPPIINGVHAADGGFFSNLPVDVIFSQGAMGGSECVFVVATPLDVLKPDSEFIDYKTVFLLRELQSIQLNALRRLRGGGQGFFAPPFRTPVFVIQPKAPLESKLVNGFCKPKVMAEDIRLGELRGREFVNAIEGALHGKPMALRPFHLLEIELPELPETPPALDAFWISGVNQSWRK